jgi:hypothetical protein
LVGWLIKKGEREMRLFPDTKGCKTYETEANAIKAANPEALEKFKWVVAVNKEGRYHLVFIGWDAVEYCLNNGHFNVAG